MRNPKYIKSMSRALNFHSNKGFTLIELAVVLAIIGAIVSAVMVGRDVQRTAEYTKIIRTFVDQWALTAENYEARMGVPIGDNRFKPTRKINGAKNDNSTVEMNGADALAVDINLNAICGGETGSVAGRKIESEWNHRDILIRAGLDLPKGNGPGEEHRYSYLDANGIARQLVVCFQYNAPQTQSGVGNVMVIAGMTHDLARAIAKHYNGNTSANTGRFRQAGRKFESVGANAASVVDWSVDALGESAFQINTSFADGGGASSQNNTQATEAAYQAAQETRTASLVGHLRLMR